MTTMFDAAVQGLDVIQIRHADGGVVRVRDGEDTWLCDADAWEAVAAQLQEREQDSGDTYGSDSYSLLCRKVRSLSPIASINGYSRGYWRPLVESAYAAGLIDADDVEAFGVEVPS